MDRIPVPAGTWLQVFYTLYRAERPVSDRLVVLHHGICHTHEQFLPLIGELNARGLHAAAIEQQSANAGWVRNCIGIHQYRRGKAAAVRQIERDTGLRVGTYVNHSMGAFIGEETQDKHPELRRPTVMMTPIPVDGALPITLRLLWGDPQAYLRAVLTLDIHSLVDTPDELRRRFFDCRTPQEIVDRTATQLQHAPFWMYLQLVIRFMFPRIQNDGLPKMLLWSETDEIFHRWEYGKTRARYPQMEEHQITGGHDFFIENAAETADLIADFHRRHHSADC